MNEAYRQDLVRDLAELRARVEVAGIPLATALAVLRFITARSHVARPVLRRRFHLTASQVKTISWSALDLRVAEMHLGAGVCPPPGRCVLRVWPEAFRRVLELDALVESKE